MELIFNQHQTTTTRMTKTTIKYNHLNENNNNNNSNNDNNKILLTSDSFVKNKINIKRLRNAYTRPVIIQIHEKLLIHNLILLMIILIIPINYINARIPDDQSTQPLLLLTTAVSPPSTVQLVTPSIELAQQEQQQQQELLDLQHQQQQQQQLLQQKLLRQQYVLEHQQNSICFYAEDDLCYLPRENEFCKECIPHPILPNSLVCCNVTDIDKSISCIPNPIQSDNSTYWTNLHIRNATLDELDIPLKYKRLRSLVITDGHIKTISNTFSRFSSLQCLNISNNNLFGIYPRAFKDLIYLQVLDISHNNLSTIPNLVATNLTLDIRGNSAMLCKSVLEAFERGGIHFVEPDATSCLTNQTFNWFNTTDSIVLSQLERMKQLQSECPYINGYGNCTCDPERMAYDGVGGSRLVFTAKVDCSGLGLTELPDKLPANTLSLNVSNNNITSLSALNGNPFYKHIIRLYADHNKISSMLDLEGTEFIENFNTLSLRHNTLKSVPIYLLSNTLDRSPPDGRLLYLEGNHLNCDCTSATDLKLWLLARQNHITDYDRILCENIPSKVVDLSEKKLCKSQHLWKDYIFYLIAAEVLMLVALIMKVSYDYWIFKTAGYLPWPASKMPKLPCDWLCES